MIVLQRITSFIIAPLMFAFVKSAPLKFAFLRFAPVKLHSEQESVSFSFSRSSGSKADALLANKIAVIVMAFLSVNIVESSGVRDRKTR
jgi:hypothetical protein